MGTLSSLDFGRGCPYQCSFCTIINVQGRKSRFRNADDLERILRENYAQGIKRFFITDDNFARNREWEQLFDRIIKLREEEGMMIGFTIQVDTLCHKIPNFIEKATRAGARPRVHRAGEHQSRQSDRGQEAPEQDHRIPRRCCRNGATTAPITCAGYILGFPADTKESILRDIEIIKRELPLDILEFFFLTPLPGSEDHQRSPPRASGWTRTSTNTTSTIASSHHPKMSDAEWEDAYRAAWAAYYTDRPYEDDSAPLRRRTACAR